MTKIIALSKQKIPAIIFTVLTAILVAFIWLHSLAPAKVSEGESSNILGILQGLLNSLHIDTELTSYIIRKSAHFCEFAALGAMVTATFKLYAEKISKFYFHILFILLAVPVVDEGLQYLAEGRSPQVNDVLLDFSGCVTGMLFALIVIVIVRSFSKRKNKKQGVCD